VATGCADGRVRVWEADKTRSVLPSLEAPGRPLEVAFSPSGERLLAATDDKFRLWEARTGRSLLTADGWVTAFSDDERMLVPTVFRPARLDGSAALLQLMGGQELRALSIGRAEFVRLSPDGGLLVAAGRDRVRLFDLVGEELASLPVDNARALEFDRTGDLWTNGSNGVLRWPFRTDAAGNVTVGPPEKLGPGARTSPDGAVVGTVDGRFLARGGSGRVELLRADTGADACRLPAPESGRLAPQCFSSDGALLAAKTAEGFLYLWDLRSLRAGLRELGLDDDLPDYPKAAPRSPMRVRVDLGVLGTQ
jgi:WD40 repeat protein